jgi:hypothetical protein
MAMREMVVLYTDWEDHVEAEGVFANMWHAVEFMWARRLEQRMIGLGPKGQEVEAVFNENLAALELRPEPNPPKLAGIGAATFYRLWICQNTLEGRDTFLIGVYEASDKQQGAGVHRYKTFRCAQGTRGPIYVHQDHSIGQMVEEYTNKLTAVDVERKLAGLPPVAPFPAPLDPEERAKWEKQYERRGSKGIPRADAKKHLENRSFLCEACFSGVVPGALFPFAPDGRTDHAYVQRCDDCDLFQDDAAAAVAVATVLNKQADLSVDQNPFVIGVTFQQAQKLKVVRFLEPPVTLPAAKDVVGEEG